MTQFSYTDAAWAALAKNPVNRKEAIGALFEKVGGKLIDLYYCLGEYDGIAITEAPDDQAVVAALVAVVGAGHIKGIKTTKLLSSEDMVAALGRSHSLTYGAPK